MALINFLGLFYILLFFVLGYLYFKEQDKWFKVFYFIGAVGIFILLINFSYFQSNIDNGNSIQVNYDLLDNIDINDNDYLGQDIIDKSTDVLLFNFKFSDKLHYNYKNSLIYSDFCFAYNNTDASNVIRVNSGINPISDYYYIINNSFGDVCIEINISNIKHNNLLGIRCLDCSVGNTLGIPYVNGSLIDEVYVTKADPLTYTIEKTIPHKMWVENYYTPNKLINTNYWLFVRFIGVFAMMFIFRFLYLFTKNGVL